MQQNPTGARLVAMKLPRLRLALALLLTAALTAVWAPTASSAAGHTDTVDATSLTGAFVGVSAYSVTLAKGQGITFVGHLADPTTNTDLRGESVGLYARSGTAGSWVNIRTLVTNVHGRVHQLVTPNYATQLQWRFAGSAGEAASVSPVFTINIGLRPTLFTITGSVTIAKGQSTTVTGHLQDSQTVKGIPGQTVDLLVRTNPEGSWTRIKTLLTNSDGKVSQLVTPNYTTQVQWRYAATTVHQAATSPTTTITIGIPPTLLTITSSVTIAKGQSTTVVGHLTDYQTGANLPGQTVGLYARTNPTGTWTNIKTLVTNSDGKVSQLVTPNYTTELQWRYAGTSVHAAQVSPIITVTVSG